MVPNAVSELGLSQSDRPARSAIDVLRTRNLGLFLLGNLVSASGTWFQNIAAAILIFRLTGSTFFVGLVNLAQYAGVVALAPWSGSAADRFDRRRLLIGTQLAAALLAATLAILVGAGLATPPVIIGIMLLIGLTFAFSVPAIQSLVPLLVQPDDIAPAVAVNAATFNVARAIGPVLGATVVATMGFTWAFAINAGTYCFLVVALLLIRPRRGAPDRGERRRLRDSVAVVRADRRLLVPLLVVAAVAIAIDPVTTLTPAFAVDIYGRADTFTGWLVTAFGAGAVVTVLFVVRWLGSGRSIAVPVGVLVAGLILFAMSRHTVVGLTGLFLAGMGYLASVTATTTELHTRTADEHLGRVMAMWSIGFQGTRPLAALTDGTVATLAGVRVAGVLMAIPAGIAALVLGARRLLARRRGLAP